MKKFYLLTKTLLVAVCLLAGASNVWGAPTEYLTTWTGSVGTDNSADLYYGTKKVRIAAGETYVFTLKNYNDGGATTWHNWVVEGNSGDKFFDCCPNGDSWPYGTGAPTPSYTPVMATTDVADFMTKYNGATVTVTISRNAAGNQITVVHTSDVLGTTDGNTDKYYGGTYTVAVGAEEAWDVYLTQRYSHFVVTNVTYTDAESNVSHYNSLYERGTISAWATSDVASGQWSTGTVTEGLAAAGGKLSQSGTNAGYSSTKTISPTSGYKVAMTAVATMGGASGRNGSYDYIRIGGAELRVLGQDQKAQVYIDGSAQGEQVTATRNAAYTFTVLINQTTGNVTYSVSGGATIAEATTSTITTISNVAVGHYRGGQENYETTVNLTNISISEEAPSETYADYTVKYVSTISAVETEIKSNVVRKGEVDATVTLEGSDKNTITYGGHQYYYVSDNASTSTIKNDNSTVVKVVFAQATFDNGAYYFKNKANGAYFAAGNSWGTHAITNSIGHVVSLSVQSGGSYYLDTQVSNGGANHYLNGVWTDGAAQGWTIASDGAGYYTINNGSGNLTAGAVGGDLTVGASTDDAAKWTVMTAAAWKAENVARLDAATASNGVDATFYIPAANFNRNDNTENAKWQGGPALGGDETNCNAEKSTNPYATFDVYQALTGVKPGAYKLTAQGFYRNGLNNASDANDNLAKLYANSSEVALKNIRYYGNTDDSHNAEGFTTAKSGIYVPNSKNDATKAFDAGYFENELYVVVGEDGNLRVGVKKDAATGANEDWACFDNFQLTYYGTSVSGTITPAGWCSFASSYPLDLSKISGGTVYYASAADGSTITLTSTGDVTVPAGEGLMIKGTPNAEFTINVAASGTSISGNKLIGQTTTGNVTASGTDGKYHYVFGYESSSFYGFYNLTEDTSVSAGKAYLETTTALSAGLGARAISIVLADDILTGINEAEAATEAVQKEGKFVVDGKLVIFKKGMKFNANGARIY